MTLRYSERTLQKWVNEKLREEHGQDYICPHGFDNWGSYCPTCDKAFVKRLDEYD